MAGDIGEAEAWRQNVCFICYLVIKIAESLISVHIKTFLGQSKSKASMLECPWSHNDCVELSQTLLEESVPATRETTWSVLKGRFLRAGSLPQTHSQLRAASWLAGAFVTEKRWRCSGSTQRSWSAFICSEATPRPASGRGLPVTPSSPFDDKCFVTFLYPPEIKFIELRKTSIYYSKEKLEEK